jgi:pyruvate/2-oxoglutarate dehydrogenase complex dihydrolipoamide dehydrogenase (E3) component
VERETESSKIITAEHFDLVIIGCGAASKLSAWDFAGQGQRVAVIERKYVGGSCPTVACLPSKNIIYTAQVASYIRRLDEFGMTVTQFEVNMAGVRERKRKMVEREVQLHLTLFQKSGAELIFGEGRFVAPKVIEVVSSNGDVRRLHGERVVIGTGTHAYLGDTPGLEASGPMTHVEALELDVVPDHLIILGAGFVGLEFAQAMRRFGSKVTLIDHNSRLLHHEDQDVSEGVQALLIDEGIELELNAELLSVTGVSGKEVCLLVEQGGHQREIRGTHILVAAGRTPNTRELGLELGGVEQTKEGYVKVNEKLETTAPGVWAVGDVAGSPQFTHVSKDDYRIFRSSVMGENRVTTNRLIPYCLFLEPELARVGFSETEAQRQNVEYRLFKVPMASVLRAEAIVEPRGFMKALVAESDHSIIGFTAFGFNAGEVMSAVQLAMLAKLPYTSIRDAIIAHPTMVEGLQALFSLGSQELVSA